LAGALEEADHDKEVEQRIQNVVPKNKLSPKMLLTNLELDRPSAEWICGGLIHETHITQLQTKNLGALHDDVFPMLADAILASKVTSLKIDDRELNMEELRGHKPLLSTWAPTLSAAQNSQHSVTAKSFGLHVALMARQKPDQGLPWVDVVTLDLISSGPDRGFPSRVIHAMTWGFESAHNWLSRIRILTIPEPMAPITESELVPFCEVLFKGASSLVELNFYGVSQVTADCLAFLPYLCQHQTLRRLCLSRCGIEAIALAQVTLGEHSLSKYVATMPNLEELILHGNPIKHWALSIFKHGKGCLFETLKLLDLGHTQMSEGAIKQFAEGLLEFRVLEVLILRNLADTATKGMDEICENLLKNKACYSLTHLDMASCRLSAEGAEDLSRWVRGGVTLGGNLKLLDIHNNKFDDDAAEHIAQAMKAAQNLKMRLHDCGFSQEKQRDLFAEFGERAGGCFQTEDGEDGEGGDRPPRKESAFSDRPGLSGS